MPVWAFFYMPRITFSGFTECGKNVIINVNYDNSVPFGTHGKGRIFGTCIPQESNE